MVHRTIAEQNKESGALDSIARGLGWFSIALGVAELLAPRTVTRSVGLESHSRTAQFFGLREIAAGIGLLTAKDPTPWVWGRVAGDVLDLAGLARGLRHDNPERANAGLALGAVAAVTLLDLCCASQLQAAKGGRFRDAVDAIENAAGDVAERAVDSGQETADRAKAAAQDAAVRAKKTARSAAERMGDAAPH